VECTTTVYHFGERILETKQILGPREYDVERHMYHFDFVPQFFEAFLAGFQCFEGDAERKIAIENLSIMQ
ncbi:hypothetical protein BC832DRAFT_522619, partial [Gaertneriomyces semiglobifer]